MKNLEKVQIFVIQIIQSMLNLEIYQESQLYIKCEYYVKLQIQANGMDQRQSPEGHHRFASQSSNQPSQNLNQSNNRRLYIERNSQEQQQIVIPYWDEQNSSTHYHLIEEIRLLKKKNLHFQSHMGRMKIQYEQLRNSLELMDQNQKQHIRKISQMAQRYNIAVTKIQELKGELDILKDQNNQLRAQLRGKEIREEEMRKRMNKLKDNECLLNSRLIEMEQQLRLLTLRNQQQKKILQKSRHSEMQILKQNLHTLQSEPRKDLTNSSHLAELKALVQEKENRISELEELKQGLATQNKKLKSQLEKERAKNNDLSFKNSSESNFGEELQNMRIKYNKELDRLRIQANALKSEIIKLGDQKQYFKLQMIKYQQEKNDLRIAYELKQKKSKQKYVKFGISSAINLSLSSQKSEESKQSLLKLSKLQKENKEYEQKLKIKQDQIINLIFRLKNAQLKHQEYQTKIQKIEKDHRSVNELKDREIQVLKKQIDELRRQIQLKSRTQNQMKIKILELQKSNIVAEDDKTLSELQIQYNNELQALRRLILYKKYPNNAQSENSQSIRKEYQKKFDILVADYQQLQKQLLVLQESLLKQQLQNNTVRQTREIITFRTSEEERVLYLQAIRKWEIAYEQLKAIHEAKMVSKDEEINLLNLKLLNLGSIL